MALNQVGEEIIEEFFDEFEGHFDLLYEARVNELGDRIHYLSEQLEMHLMRILCNSFRDAIVDEGDNEDE